MSRRKSTRRGLAIFLSLLCLALLSIGIWLFWNERLVSDAFSNRPKSTVEQMDPSAQPGTLSNSPSKVRSPGANHFGYRLNITPTFSGETPSGSLQIENPPFNRYLLIVELSMEDDQPVLYRSQYIPPDYHINSVSLTRPLAPGEHLATVYLNLIDPDTYELVDILDCPIRLTVE